MCRIVYNTAAVTQFSKLACYLVCFNGVPRVELIVCGIGREVCRPECYRVGLSVGENIEFVTDLYPQSVRIIFGIEFAEPAVSTFCFVYFFPVVGRIRYEIGYGRFIYIEIDCRAVVGDVVAHDVCRAVRQYFDTTHLASYAIGYGHLLRGSKGAVSVKKCNIEGRFLVGYIITVVLITADCRCDDHIVIFVKTNAVCIFAHGHSAVICKTAVFLNDILHQVTWVISCRRIPCITAGIYIGNDIKVVAVDHDCFTVELAGISKFDAFEIDQVLFEVDRHIGLRCDGGIGDFTDTDGTFVIAGYIDKVIRTCYAVRVASTFRQTRYSFREVSLAVEHITRY